jgi:hypothetical protein
MYNFNVFNVLNINKKVACVISNNFVALLKTKFKLIRSKMMVKSEI